MNFYRCKLILISHDDSENNRVRKYKKRSEQGKIEKVLMPFYIDTTQTDNRKPF